MRKYIYITCPTCGKEFQSLGYASHRAMHRRQREKGSDSKFYFRGEFDEMCFRLHYHLSDAKSEGLTEIELFEAIPEKVGGMFWCRAVLEPTEEGYCGKQCEEYEPKNGKSGMCRHKSNTFYGRGPKEVFKVN